VLAERTASITAPMKFDRSVTSPIVSESTSAAKSSRIFCHTDRAT
jgi:hypothetical protein